MTKAQNYLKKSIFLHKKLHFSQMNSDKIGMINHNQTGDKLSNLIVVGDKVLIKPCSSKTKTRGGLLLPPGYSAKEEIQYGYVVKTGPGTPVPFVAEDDSEPWKPKSENSIKYIPLQSQPGDLAIFLLNGSVEINYQDQKYFIVPHYQILMLEREEA
jgi:co-chaperonin GroES (HSP10)